MWDGVNRRQFARAQYPCLLILRKDSPEDSVLSHTEDVSVGGMRVIISKKLEPEQEITIEVDLKDTLPNVKTKAVVNWCKQAEVSKKAAKQRYDIGLRFVSLADSDRHRIQRIVEHFTAK